MPHRLVLIGTTCAALDILWGARSARVWCARLKWLLGQC
jgi:hypothetical protein